MPNFHYMSVTFCHSQSERTRYTVKFVTKRLKISPVMHRRWQQKYSVKLRLVSGELCSYLRLTYALTCPYDSGTVR